MAFKMSDHGKSDKHSCLSSAQETHSNHQSKNFILIINPRTPAKSVSFLNSERALSKTFRNTWKSFNFLNSERALSKTLRIPAKSFNFQQITGRKIY